MADPLLEVRDLTVRFGGKAQAVLDGVNLELHAGETMAVLGESGAGKTTLGRAILGLLPNSALVHGRILLRGSELPEAKSGKWEQIRGAQISLIAQDPELALSPVMRVDGQVTEVLRAHVRLRKQDRRERALATLVAAGLPVELARAYPHQLSGGQRQRVVIAQALAANPALLIADEPTSALDNVVQTEILRLLRRLVQEFRLSLLFITHDPVMVRELADRLIVMREGRVVEAGSFAGILRSPRHPYTAKLAESIVPLPAPPENANKTLPMRPNVLEADEICKTYYGRGRTTRAVDHLSLRLPVGTALALVGKSGAGKSTLARCLALLEKPDSGEIRFHGERTRIQLVWQHSAIALNPRFRAVDIAAEPLRLRKRMSKTESRDCALEMMLKLGLPAALSDRRPLELSGGQRQRLALARALVLRPSVLILDEAFAGLDLPVQAEIAAMLLELKTSLSLSYVLITHDLRRAASFADQIAVMENGRIVEQGDPRRLFWRPEHEATRQLVDAI